jgi:hypothetical protein
MKIDDRLPHPVKRQLTQGLGWPVDKETVVVIVHLILPVRALVPALRL